MAASARRRHGNYPQRRATLLPQGYRRSAAGWRTTVASENRPTETGPNLATETRKLSFTTEKPSSFNASGTEVKPRWTFLGKAKMSIPPPKQRHLTVPGFSSCRKVYNMRRSYGAALDQRKAVDIVEEITVASSPERIRIHPEVQRILGSSCVAVVRLERLRFPTDPGESVYLPITQPLSSSVAPAQCQPHTEPQGEEPPLEVMTPEVHPPQSGSDQHVEPSAETTDESYGSDPGSPELSQKEPMDVLWTEPHTVEPFVPPSPPAGQEPEQSLNYESEFDSELQYEWDRGIKFDSFESVIDLDPEPEGESDPEESESALKPISESDLEPEQNVVLELDFESESESGYKVESDSEREGNGDGVEDGGVVEDSEEEEEEEGGGESEGEGPGGNRTPSQGYLVSSDQPERGEGTEDRGEETEEREEGMEETGGGMEEGEEVTGGMEEEEEVTTEEREEGMEETGGGMEEGEEETTEEREEGDEEETEGGMEEGRAEMESEDYCAVCLNGGELLCCDGCPKVFHLSCHVPPLTCFPRGDWVCTLCRSDQEPSEGYDCENTHSSGGLGTPYTLSRQDQTRCEKLTLLLSTHVSSAPFHEPVSPLARHYYQIIKRPIDLSVIRRKLNKDNTLHYFSAEQFVDDVVLMFRNCATFNYPDSEVAQAGCNLEAFFLTKLQEVFPDRSFPVANQDRVHRARLSWLNRKRKKHVLSGKKYRL